MFQQNIHRDVNSYANPFLLKVIGEAESTEAPNLASIHLGVISESKELLAVQQQNAQQIAKVIQALMQLNIPKERIQTFDYRIDTEYDFEQGKQLFRGYKVTHLLQVKLEDLNSIGKVIDTAVKNGANYVADVQFMAKDTEDHYQRILSAAVMNAVQKAKVIASALQVSINPIPLMITEGAGDSRPAYTQPGSYVKGITSTQIEPGQLLLKASVSATFQYYPK